jgi:CheY-like chemotaxis protein
MKTILLADDEANLRMLVHTTLDDPQYRLLEAGDGATALNLARQERPDLLVLDWMMPGMTGIDVALAETIIATYGGQIRAESQGVGKGATFTVDFPRLSLL